MQAAHVAARLPAERDDRGLARMQESRRAVGLEGKGSDAEPAPQKLDHALRVVEVGRAPLGPPVRRHRARHQHCDPRFLPGPFGSVPEDAAHLEDPQVTAPLPQVRPQRGDEAGHHEAAPQHALLFRQRVREAQPRRRVRAGLGIRDEGVVDHLGQASSHQRLPYLARRHLHRTQTLRAVRRGHGRLDPVDAEVPADFLDEIRFPADVAAPGRDLDLPCRGLLLHREAETREYPPRAVLRHRRAEHGRGARGPEHGRSPRSGHGPPVYEPRTRLPRADLREQMGDARGGVGRRLGIGAPLEAVRRLGVHAQRLARAPEGDR